ncbi:MAG: hypothetical protein PHS17_18115, partial [Desulfobacterales bacterium]|nr:hypothetical protein [Desulfobacterales bacterium]
RSQARRIHLHEDEVMAFDRVENVQCPMWNVQFPGEGKTISNIKQQNIECRRKRDAPRERRGKGRRMSNSNEEVIQG